MLFEVIHFVQAAPPTLNGITHFTEALSVQLNGVNIASRVVALSRLRRPWHCLSRPEMSPEVPWHVPVLHFDAGLLDASWGRRWHNRLQAPILLALAARRLRSRPRVRLIIICHEVMPARWPHCPSFLEPLRKHAFRMLLGTAATVITSNSIYASRLSESQPRGPIKVEPVFSNVEPQRPPLIAMKKSGMAVFGSTATIRRSLAMILLIWEQLARDAKIANVEVIGGAADTVIDQLIDQLRQKVPVQRQADLSQDEVSARLAAATYGFIDYLDGGVVDRLPLLNKSGVYAAYCAHGVIPIVSVAEGDRRIAKGVLPNVDGTEVSLASVQAIDASRFESGVAVLEAYARRRSLDRYRKHFVAMVPALVAPPFTSS